MVSPRVWQTGTFGSKVTEVAEVIARGQERGSGSWERHFRSVPGGRCVHGDENWNLNR